MEYRPPGTTALALVQIVTGLFYVITGFPEMILLNITGFLFMGAAICMFVVGWELRNLKSWAWWAALVLNIATIILAFFYSENVVASSTAMSLGIITVLYLFVPNIRQRFI
ncbi:MAG: hypothetical protein ACXADS_10000 [Candidatus Thorarchaeota archaeon]|jgi:hypothetical protein